MGLLSSVIEARNQYCGELKTPLLLKIAPDLTNEDKKDIVDVIKNKKVKIIVTLLNNNRKLFFNNISFVLVSS